MDKKPKGVLLLAFGTASGPEETAPFLKNIFKGRPVASDTVERVKERYRMIGGSSPLLDITRAQASALASELNATSGAGPFAVYVGMLYWDPFIKETIKEMWADGIEEAVAVIMAQHSSRGSTGWYEDAVEAALKTTGGVPNLRYLPDWHTNPLVVDAIADNISVALTALPAFPDMGDVLIIFSAHSLPVASLKGDEYLEKLRETVEEVLKRTGPVDTALAFQSKSPGPAEWLSPEVETVMEEAKGMGKKGVLVVPLGFVSDHVETLYDIDIEFRRKAESLGLAFARSASLNTTPKFIKALAGAVRGVRFDA